MKRNIYVAGAKKRGCGISQDINMIVLCNYKECQYCHEGECGKEVLYIEDSECIALANKGK